MVKNIDDTPLACATRILQATERICRLCEQITDAGHQKAQMEVNYECAIEKATVTLKSEGMQTTIIKDVARGKCRKESLAAKIAEINYKSLIVKINAAEAILNGYQSMNRHLDKV